MPYSRYYQAHVPPTTACIFVALLRSYEHLTFDRTFDQINSIFEFFVPEDTVAEFLTLMHELASYKLVGDLKELPNRMVQ